MSDCDFMFVFMSVLVGAVVGLVVGPVCWILGRRSHPVEKAARRKAPEYIYPGRGGEPVDFS